MVLKCLSIDFLLVAREKKDNYTVGKLGHILNSDQNEHHQ